MGIRGEIFSSRATAGDRTYFFNVKENRRGETFLNIVESCKRRDDDFERQSLMVYDEDLRAFLTGLNDAVAALQKHRERSR